MALDKAYILQQQEDLQYQRTRTYRKYMNTIFSHKINLN